MRGASCPDFISLTGLRLLAEAQFTRAIRSHLYHIQFTVQWFLILGVAMSLDDSNSGISRLTKTILTVSALVGALGALAAGINALVTDTKPWVCLLASFSWCETQGPAETWSENVGGPGGSPFGPLTCHPEQALVGLYGRAIAQNVGPFVFSIGPVCAPAHFNWRGRLTSLSAGALTKGETAGSQRGNSFELLCPSGTVVVGATSDSASMPVNDGLGNISKHDYLVVPLSLKCSNVLSTGNDSAIRTVTGAGEPLGNASQKPFYCPDGNVAFGIKGRSGDFVDALSLGCRRT
jgi:hypothetical protein